MCRPERKRGGRKVVRVYGGRFRAKAGLSELGS